VRIDEIKRHPEQWAPAVLIHADIHQIGDDEESEETMDLEAAEAVV
jgi:hypothetical protein